MHSKIQGMFRLIVLILIGAFARGDVTSTSLDLTLKSKRDVWITTKANLQTDPAFEILNLSFHNSSNEPCFYTLYQISLIIRTRDGRQINSSLGGGDFYIPPTSNDFFALAPGQTQVYKIRVYTRQLFSNQSNLCYEQPSGGEGGWLLRDGNYEIGVKYSIDKKYLESINYSEKKPYGLLVEENSVWLGKVLSNFVPVKIMSKS